MGCSLLLVDDEESVHRLVSHRLSDVRLLHAYNGWQMREVLATEAVDLVLLDINLPDVSGFVLLEELRSDQPPYLVVMFTCDNNPALRRRALALGASAYVDKSLDGFNALSAVIERALP